MNPSSPSRYKDIDFVRGFCICLILLIHATRPYTDQALAHFVWDFAHFDVPLILFCSGASLWAISLRTPTEIGRFWLQRFARLLLPWWSFLVIYYAAFMAIEFHRTSTLVFPLEHAVGSLVFFGLRDGIGFGWWIALMLTVAIVFPFLQLLDRHVKNARVGLALLIGVSVVFQFAQPGHAVKWAGKFLFFLPSLFFFYFGLHFQEFKKKWNAVGVALLMGALFIFQRFLLSTSGRNLELIANKYPPNFYYLSYCVAGLFALLALHSFLDSRFAQNKLNQLFQSALRFLSMNSLWIYLWHIGLLKITAFYRTRLDLNWVSEFLLILGGELHASHSPKSLLCP